MYTDNKTHFVEMQGKMQHGCPHVFDYIDFLKSKNTTVMATFSQNGNKWTKLDQCITV